MVASQDKVRIRENMEPDGVIGMKAAARKYSRYGLAISTLSGWVKSGQVEVTAADGAGVLLDERSLRRKLESYKSHGDNRTRTKRSYTRRDTPASSSAEAQQPLMARSAEEKVNLKTREWVDKFYGRQATNAEGGNLNPNTRNNYDWVFGSYVERFPIVPMERWAVLEYLHGLTDKRGNPMSPGSKNLHKRTLTTFYTWLKNTYGYNTPLLSGERGLAARRQNVGATPAKEMRLVMAQARNHEEYTLLLLLAQTGVRLSELCSMRPEFLQPYWIYVWGKATGNNPSGRRPVPLPDEAYKHLCRMFETRDELVWVDSYGAAHALAGPVEPANPPRPADPSRPETCQVRPRQGATRSVQDFLKVLMVRAGVKNEWDKGKLTHSIRHAYTTEVLENGGSERLIDKTLGHLKTSDMGSLYTNATIDQLVNHARKYAPRAFLQEDIPQGTLPLEPGVDAAEL